MAGTPTYDYTWPQGEDLDITFTYKEGPDGQEQPKDISTYHLRMDVVDATGALLYTFNTLDPDLPGDQEATLGADGSVTIAVPRSLTLPNGELYDAISQGMLQFNYDIFLRDDGTPSKQKKLYRGSITIEPSYTLWS